MFKESNNLEQKMTAMIERWFISEPPLFQVMCRHKLMPNPTISCPIRCGKMRIEYNPLLLAEMSDSLIEEILKCEALRILLKHPYDRKPEQCSLEATAIGSNMVLKDNYFIKEHDIEAPDDFGLERNKNYEWYACQVQKMLKSEAGNSSDSSGNSTAGSPKSRTAAGIGNKNIDLAELWEEDDMTAQLINEIISNTRDWGSISGRMAELIEKSLKAKIDWKKALRGFRGSILSSEKKLTRMKPNRRYGFDAMGAKREFCSRLLIAVDVSGSISTESLKYFYGVIESAFKYGFTNVDTIQFDSEITAVQNLKKASRDIAVIGRGGTSFQKPVEYAFEQDYDGLIILTDGYAPEPVLPIGMRTKILWVCSEEKCYKDNQAWMKKYGRVTLMEKE